MLTIAESNLVIEHLNKQNITVYSCCKKLKTYVDDL